MKNLILLLLRYMHRFNSFQGLLLFVKLRVLKARTIEFKEYGKINLRTNSSDFDVFNQVFLNREYDFTLAFEPKFIVDAGANIGLTSLFFACKFPSATIIAIEPNTANFELLENNTSSHSNIIPIKKALWTNNNKILLLKSDSNDAHCITESKNCSEEVAALTIASILKKYNPEKIDILKMDIEGAEKEIFSTDFNQWLPKIKTLVIELHDRFKPGCSMSLFNALVGYYYSLVIRGELLIFNFN